MICIIHTYMPLTPQYSLPYHSQIKSEFMISLTVPCRVNVGSYGYDDSWKAGYISTTRGSLEYTYDPNDIGKNRGIVTCELDPTTCLTRNRRHFDTWASAEARVQLVQYLESTSLCTIIVGVGADSVETEFFDFRSSANWFFTKYNMNLFGVGLRFRDKVTFIIQKGYPWKTKWHRKPRGGEWLKTSFTLSG